VSTSSLPAPSDAAHVRLAVLLTAVALLLGACSITSSSGAPASPSVALATIAPVVTPAPTASPSPSPSPAPAFPVTLTDDDGTAVTLATEPQKIVSLTPAVTETLFAVGAGDRVVATDDASDYPAAAKKLPHVVDFGTVDVEKIVSLDPDLVIAGGAGFTPADAIAKLRLLKIPVLVVSSTTLDSIYTDLGLVGTAAGEGEMATALVDTLRSNMTAIGAAAQAASQQAGTKPRVFYDVGYIDTTGQIYGPAKGSFLDEMLESLGVDVITGDPVTYEVPLETLIERDPQVIILGTNAFYMPTPAIVAKRTGWSALSAVKSGDIRSVTDTEITRPGPRLATGMRDLALTMYPNLALPSMAPSGAPTASP
jgi:iron complex transport system substrate-binding protein